ncbi:UDP-N-acetylmuramoyl-L-alanine--D-glutamate ligase [candidate division KSB1 bacterium]|nr:UDP-N-acetylmuramoyl-L-alanine--D-glutamate ligase [candidate division KSB1 bacterium]
MDRFLSGKQVAVVGMARSGIGAALLAKRLGGSVLVSDRKSQQELGDHLEELIARGIRCETGGHARLESEEFDLVILSPGVVPPDAWVRRWLDRGVPIWSELELASRVWQGRWIAVTGSNGKTTTVNLIAGILRAAGLHVEMAGNVGTAWSTRLPAPETRVFVVEVSSYQLEYSPTIKPDVGVLLNLYENHLDRHGDMASYAEVKSRLFRNQTSSQFAVLNSANTWVQSVEAGIGSSKVHFGADGNAEFRLEENKLVWAHDGNIEIILNRDEFPLPGRHNALNALAAAGAAVSFGCSVAAIRQGLRSARAVEHRIEFVAERSGIRYFNDSKSTNLIATMTALDSFASNVILLFGGRAKPESFAPLAERLGKPLKSIIAFGESRQKLSQELPDEFPVKTTDDLASALVIARSEAVAGDTILLSPGCASFDQYRDFEQRGTEFKNLVRES